MKEVDRWAREPNLASLHESYSLLRSDPIRAARELESLAKRGSLMSMVYLGDAYHHGSGLPRDMEKAEHWLREAHLGGSGEGLLQLAALLIELGRTTEAEKVLREGVEQDYPPAMHRLAVLYLRAADGRARAQAKELLERASASGNLIARRRLSGLLLSGRFGAAGFWRGARLFWSAVKEGWALSRSDPTSEHFR